MTNTVNSLLSFISYFWALPMTWTSGHIMRTTKGSTQPQKPITPPNALRQGVNMSVPRNPRRLS